MADGSIMGVFTKGLVNDMRILKFHIDMPKEKMFFSDIQEGKQT